MNLYKVYRPDARGYDVCAGFVIQAPDESRARQVAAKHCGDEREEAWKDPESAKVLFLASLPNPLPADVAPRNIVLGDFHAG